VPYADIDDILERRLPIVFATDQPAFEDRANTFCVLVPLMTADGSRFEEPETTFSNRGRVWWMLKNEHIPLASVTGAIWSGPIENAVQFDESNPKKDRYQAVRFAIEPGARDWVDLIDVPFAPEDLDACLAADGLALGRRPLPLLLLRGPETVVGPFQAEWLPATQRARLRAVNPGNPTVWKVPRAALHARHHFEEYRYRAHQWYPDAAPREVVLRLMPRKILPELQALGEELDAASEEQVIKWALLQAGYTNAERQEFRQALARVGAAPTAEENPLRLARFRALCERAEKILGAGAEIAELVAKQPAFADLVRAHADELAAARVAELVGARRREVEAAISESSARRERLQKEVQGLEAAYDARKAEQDARLRTEHAEALRDLERREREVQEGVENLRAQQQGIEERLREVVTLYETRGRELGNQLLAQFPMLQRLVQGGDARARSAVEAPARSPLPAWIERPRPRGALTQEEDFLAQLRDVAARRGFVFADDDLVNFHVSAKVGFWTVLAGPSGTGKTSLPRVYAEALGSLDEYLVVPVKPDWLDDRDVVGAFNSLTGRFEPGGSGLVDHLVAAAEDLARNRGGIYLVCLDEMNLARVEHYFAQFLSVADEPVASRRHLTLYSRGVERPGEPYAPYRELPLGENVRIVGTVNVDETTHFFSPKVLDRAPVLVLEPPEIAREPAPRARAEQLDVTPVHFDEWRAWVRGPEAADAAVRDRLVEIDRHLRTMRAGLAYRVRDRILAYTASAQGLLPPDRAFDLALAQSVVPRLRAAHPRFAEAVEGLRGLLPETRFPRTANFLHALHEAGGAHDFFQLL
jgi:hypothetical protein